MFALNKTLGINIEETCSNIGTNDLDRIYCNWIVSVGVISEEEYMLKYIDIVKVIQVDGDLWRSSGKTPFEGTFEVHGVFELSLILHLPAFDNRHVCWMMFSRVAENSTKV